MPDLGIVTSNAKKRTGLPFPSTPYAGAAPLSGAPSYVTPSTTPTPTNVSQALGNTNTTIDQAKGSIQATQPFLDNYLKPNAAGTTPFRQALTNTKAGETANAYDNAVSQIRNKSASMGFSSNSQPVTFGAEAGLANERAKAIADIPNKVNLEAQPVEFQAAGMQQNQAGIYNALANTQQGEAQTLAQQKAAADAQKAALYGGLAQTGIAVGAPILAKALGIGKAAATAGAGAGAAGAAGAGSLAGITAGAVPEIPLSGIAGAGVLGGGAGAAAAPATGLTGALGLGGGSGLLGLGAATIPVIGGVIAGGVLLANHFIGQGRKAADKLTGQGGIQHAFEDTLKQIDAAPGYSPEQKWESKVQAYDKLEELGKQFAQGGGKNRLVATQMFDEISHLFGRPNPLRG